MISNPVDHTIVDSTLYPDRYSRSVYDAVDTALRVGTVRSKQTIPNGEVKYIVEVSVSGNIIPVSCSPMTRFGGVQNYEEFGLRAYHNAASSADPKGPLYSYDVRCGDTVIVAFLNGESTEGIILGGYHHSARKPQLKQEEIAYISEFNGIETKITESGKYTVTNNATLAVPLNTHLAGTKVPSPTFNSLVKGTFYELGDDGSWSAGDASGQLLKIDKIGKKITITSGKCSITLDKMGSTTTVNSPSVIINAQKDITVSTMIAKLEAKVSTSLKTPKIAIGNETFELISGIISLIDAIGSQIFETPTGPCNIANQSKTWPLIETIKTQFLGIKGSL